MNLTLIEQFVASMPRLRARANIEMATAIAVGTGSLKPAAARRIMRDWRRQASSGPLGQRPKAYKPKSREEHAMRLAALGIRTVPQKIPNKGG